MVALPVQRRGGCHFHPKPRCRLLQNWFLYPLVVAPLWSAKKNKKRRHYYHQSMNCKIKKVKKDDAHSKMYRVARFIFPVQRFQGRDLSRFKVNLELARAAVYNWVFVVLFNWLSFIRSIYIVNEAARVKILQQENVQKELLYYTSELSKKKDPIIKEDGNIAAHGSSTAKIQIDRKKSRWKGSELSD